MTIAIGRLKAAAKDLQDRIGGDPGKARDVLMAEGVLTAGGDIAPRYRKGSQQMAEYLHEATKDGGSTSVAPAAASRPTLKGSVARLAKRHMLLRAAKAK